MTAVSDRRTPAPRTSRREAALPRVDHRRRAESANGNERRLLDRYVDPRGCPREVLARPGRAGSVLVIDRDATTLADRRLVAHLGADEPPDNAALACRIYMEVARAQAPCCRRVTPEDLTTLPFAEESDVDRGWAGADGLVDPTGGHYQLERVATGMSIPELRWTRRSSGPDRKETCVVSIREVIACMQRYEPARPITRHALAVHRDDPSLSTAVLRAELVRVLESPIILNRRLRELVLDAVDRQGVSMSELAIRCGRIKRDHAGNVSGETSWLARRLGILAEGGKSSPTPWVHSDVLALIARRGLGISPREAEAD